MSSPRLAGALVAAGLALAAPRDAAATCPRPGAGAGDPCRPWSAMFLPTVAGAVYAPTGDGLGTYLGAGVEVVLFAWSDNADTFGPSQGKVRFDIGLFDSSRDGADSLVMYRGGVQVSLERNAARRFLIPYVTADLGALWTDGLGTRGFVDGGAGLYLYHSRRLVVDLEGAYVLPFSGGDTLSGPRAQLALSFSLW